MKSGFGRKRNAAVSERLSPSSALGEDLSPALLLLFCAEGDGSQGGGRLRGRRLEYAERLDGRVGGSASQLGPGAVSWYLLRGRDGQGGLQD